MTAPEPRQPPVRHDVWRWLAVGVAGAVVAYYGLATYSVIRFAAAMSTLSDRLARVDSCCRRPDAGSRVERGGQPIAFIVQLGTAARDRPMLLAPRFERGVLRPDTTLVGRFAGPGDALVALVPRDSVFDASPAATLVLGPDHRLVPVYRR